MVGAEGEIFDFSWLTLLENGVLRKSIRQKLACRYQGKTVTFIHN